MLRVTADELSRNIERYKEAAQHEPVALVQDGLERAMLISMEEYRRLKRRDREVLGLDDFTDADIAALEMAEAPPEVAELLKR